MSFWNIAGTRVVRARYRDTAQLRYLVWILGILKINRITHFCDPYIRDTAERPFM